MKLLFERCSQSLNALNFRIQLLASGINGVTILLQFGEQFVPQRGSPSLHVGTFLLQSDPRRLDLQQDAFVSERRPAIRLPPPPVFGDVL